MIFVDINIPSNCQENCTTIQVNDWDSYDKLAFDLWIKLYGRDFDTTVSTQI